MKSSVSRDMKPLLTFNELQDLISQKIELFHIRLSFYKVAYSRNNVPSEILHVKHEQCAAHHFGLKAILTGEYGLQRINCGLLIVTCLMTYLPTARWPGLLRISIHNMPSAEVRDH
jgi:hypothetical protein